VRPHVDPVALFAFDALDALAQYGDLLAKLESSDAPTQIHTEFKGLADALKTIQTTVSGEDSSAKFKAAVGPVASTHGAGSVSKTISGRRAFWSPTAVLWTSAISVTKSVGDLDRPGTVRIDGGCRQLPLPETVHVGRAQPSGHTIQFGVVPGNGKGQRRIQQSAEARMPECDHSRQQKGRAFNPAVSYTFYNKN
jgi:hypothetical protein